MTFSEALQFIFNVVFIAFIFIQINGNRIQREINTIYKDSLELLHGDRHEA